MFKVECLAGAIYWKPIISLPKEAHSNINAFFWKYLSIMCTEKTVISSSRTETQRHRQTDRHESENRGHPFRVSGVFPSTYHQGSDQLQITYGLCISFVIAISLYTIFLSKFKLEFDVSIIMIVILLYKLYIPYGHKKTQKFEATASRQSHSPFSRRISVTKWRNQVKSKRNAKQKGVLRRFEWRV